MNQPEPIEEELEPAEEQPESSEPEYVEMHPLADRFVKQIQIDDMQQLAALKQTGTGAGLLRNYIPGEAAPLPDPPGATYTFISLYCEVAYVRTFIANGGIHSLMLNDFVDTTQPGMASFRAELRASFNPAAFAKFVQASLNQHAIASSKTNIISLEEARRLKRTDIGNASSDWKRGPKH